MTMKISDEEMLAMLTKRAFVYKKKLSTTLDKIYELTKKTLVKVDIGPLDGPIGDAIVTQANEQADKARKLRKWLTGA